MAAWALTTQLQTHAALYHAFAAEITLASAANKAVGTFLNYSWVIADHLADNSIVGVCFVCCKLQDHYCHLIDIVTPSDVLHETGRHSLAYGHCEHVHSPDCLPEMSTFDVLPSKGHLLQRVCSALQSQQTLDKIQAVSVFWSGLLLLFAQRPPICHIRVFWAISNAGSATSGPAYSLQDMCEAAHLYGWNLAS